MQNAPVIERHPWNTEFEWVDREGPFRRLTQDQADQFNRDGFIVLDNVFSDDELAPVIAATDALEARTDEFLGGLEGGRMSIAERGAITCPSSTSPAGWRSPMPRSTMGAPTS